MTPLSIGFIGLGIMGSPMASRLISAGFNLHVYNRTLQKTKPLETMGATVHLSPRSLARNSSVIILMLTGPDAVHHVMASENGVWTTDCKGKTLVNMGTVSPECTRDLDRECSARDMGFIDAPVSGSRAPAEAGELVILAGGSQEEIEGLMPVFNILGQSVTHCGEAGQGTSMKLCINLMLGAMITGLGESVRMGERLGLSPEKLMETLNQSPLGCGLFQIKSEMMTGGQYPAQFPLKHMIKDLGFICDAAKGCGANTDMTLTALSKFWEAGENGHMDADIAAVKAAFP